MPGHARNTLADSRVLAELRESGYQVDVDSTRGQAHVTVTFHGLPGKVALGAAEVDDVLSTAVHRAEMKAAMKVLADTFPVLPVVPPPARVAALAQVEQRWRDIESEYGLLDSEQIKTLTDSRAHNRSSAASKLRTAGKALAVRRGRKLRFPAFQFADDGTVYPVIPKLLTVMSTDAGWTRESITLWLTEPNGYMPRGERPADHLADEVAVLRAADAAVSPV